MNESISSESANCSAGGRNSVRFGRAFLALFLLSLPLVNPIVHGDGVGYYAYARAPLIQHNLRFEEDWRHANLYFSETRTLPSGQLNPNQYTETGYVNNLFSIGPAMLWTPFLLVAHATVRSEEHTSELQSQSNLVCR